jgi:hypothetical protein
MVLLLLGQGGGSLRLAAVLAILCVVLIGMSVALRNDAGAVRAHLESMVLDEIDALREETREDIVAVARKLHSTLREQVADLADQIEELRDQAPQGTAVATSRVAHQDAVALGRGLVPTQAAQWRQATVRASEAGVYGNGAARQADPVGRAAPVPAAAESSLPHRTAPAWSQSPVSASPVSSGPVPAMPVSSSPVSSSPASPGPVSPSPVSPAVPGTYSTSGGNYYASGGRANRNGHGVYSTGAVNTNGGAYPQAGGAPNGYANGSSYTNGNGYSNANGYSNGNEYPEAGHYYQAGGRDEGRRRAPEPDAQAPVAAIESGHRTSDPWADLRGDTEPSDPYSAGNGGGRPGSRYGRASVGPGPYQQAEPNPDWGGTYR